MRGLGRRHVGGEGCVANGAGGSVGVRGQGGIRRGALLVLVHIHATCRGKNTMMSEFNFKSAIVCLFLEKNNMTIDERV